MRSVKFQFAWVSAGRLLGAALQALTLVLVARRLGPEEFGLLGAVIAAAMIPQVVCDLGLGTLILKARAIEPNNRTVAVALKLNRVTSIVGSLVFAVGVGALAFFFDSRFYWMLPLAVWVGAEKNADVSAGVLIADGRAHLSSVLLFGRRAMILLSTIGFLALDFNAAFAFSLASAGSSLVAAVVTGVLVSKRVQPARLGGVRRLLERARPYWIHSMATQVRSVDTLATAALAGPVQAGYYTAASRVTNPLRIVPTSLAAVLLPELARSSGVMSASTRKGIIALLIALGGLFAVLAAGAPWYVPLVLGSAYDGAILPLQIVLIGLVFGSAASMLVSVLQARGLQASVGRISIGSSLVYLVCLAVTAPVWGATGAALSLSLSFIVQSLLLLTRTLRAPSRLNRAREKVSA
ncbi:oligosaccharide flippase family protein [Gordonia alkanivorans]|uniref:lipopolysaccharide biosynthesis protein n=1 Tax=Gordonia alkanivorans TaxID=84096 RepID=UPI00244C3ADF|nr:oligosaccharide flippase family protein [Gordonia alkanivorans]MDH3022469.1 oligosaccharide flippase family protein [Gordonia alkanivorans]